MDDFRVVRPASSPDLLCKIAPAISPIYGNNPGYQVYDYDRTTGEVKDYRTFYLTNLPDQPNPPSAPPPPPSRWGLEYAFDEAYAAPGFNLQTVTRLEEAMKSNSVLRQRYTTYYVVSAAPEFNDQAFEVYRCAIANITPSQFLRCLTNEPTPKTPRPHPDRQRMPVVAERP